ncbi:nuclease-related domain-containing protein [Jatrophihabitans sp. DSM 45814]
MDMNASAGNSQAGRQAVADVVSPLAEDGYYSLATQPSAEGLVGPYPEQANAVDHILVGPGGIFVIGVKHWLGKIDAQGDILRLNGTDRSSEVDALQRACRAIERVAGLESHSTTAVLCFTGPAYLVRTRIGSVELVPLDALRRFIRGQRADLTAIQVAAVLRSLEQPPSLATAQAEPPKLNAQPAAESTPLSSSQQAGQFDLQAGQPAPARLPTQSLQQVGQQVSEQVAVSDQHTEATTGLLARLIHADPHPGRRPSTKGRHRRS